MLKVVVKCAVIEGENYAVVCGNDSRCGLFYGTVPYSELDENGETKRALNGFDMAIVTSFNEFSPIVSALIERHIKIARDKYLSKHAKTRKEWSVKDMNKFLKFMSIKSFEIEQLYSK